MNDFREASARLSLTIANALHESLHSSLEELQQKTMKYVEEMVTNAVAFQMSGINVERDLQKALDKIKGGLRDEVCDMADEAMSKVFKDLDTSTLLEQARKSLLDDGKEFAEELIQEAVDSVDFDSLAEKAVESARDDIDIESMITEYLDNNASEIIQGEVEKYLEQLTGSDLINEYYGKIKNVAVLAGAVARDAMLLDRVKDHARSQAHEALTKYLTTPADITYLANLLATHHIVHNTIASCVRGEIALEKASEARKAGIIRRAIRWVFGW